MPSNQELYKRIFTPPDRAVDIAALVKEAKDVLHKNWTGSFTVPSVNLYPHQWSWDSAFITIGYSHYNQNRAQQELSRLISGQWSNGMIPQIIFNPQADEDDYFPGPDFWGTDCTPVASVKPRTSGVCQPPLHATALLFVLVNAEDQNKAVNFAKRIFPKLKAWHNFLYRERDPANEGLVYIRHPWASGMDNSPGWDQVLKKIDLDQGDLPDYQRKDLQKGGKIEERPSDYSYDHYVKLLTFFKKRRYNENKIRKDGCPFMVQSVLFNSILCKAGRDLALIAEWLGEDPIPFHHQSNMTAKGVNKKLWNEEHNIYLDYDLANDQLLDGHSLAGFLPMYADIPSPRRAQKMFDYLDTGSFCNLHDECLAIPSYDRRESNFNSKKYWRGPIWINLNWMLYNGLRRYGHWKYVRLIRNSILYLAERSGFYEYYDPITGEGIGEENFSWSAALFLDLINFKRQQEAKKTGKEDNI